MEIGNINSGSHGNSRDIDILHFPVQIFSIDPTNFQDSIESVYQAANQVSTYGKLFANSPVGTTYSLAFTRLTEANLELQRVLSHFDTAQPGCVSRFIYLVPQASEQKAILAVHYLYVLQCASEDLASRSDLPNIKKIVHTIMSAAETLSASVTEHIPSFEDLTLPMEQVPNVVVFREYLSHLVNGPLGAYLDHLKLMMDPIGRSTYTPCPALYNELTSRVYRVLSHLQSYLERMGPMQPSPWYQDPQSAETVFEEMNISTRNTEHACEHFSQFVHDLDQLKIHIEQQSTEELIGAYSNWIDTSNKMMRLLR